MALRNALRGRCHLDKALDVLFGGYIFGSFEGAKIEIAPHYFPCVGTIVGLTQELVLNLWETFHQLVGVFLVVHIYCGVART